MKCLKSCQLESDKRINQKSRNTLIYVNMTGQHFSFVSFQLCAQKGISATCSVLQGVQEGRMSSDIYDEVMTPVGNDFSWKSCRDLFTHRGSKKKKIDSLYFLA